MLAVNDRAAAHDPAGNLLSWRDARFAFDGAGQLVRVSRSASEIGYRYDGDGLLCEREGSGPRHVFLADPQSDIWRPLLVRDQAGDETLYIWHGNEPVGRIRANQGEFFLHDHLGSVTAVVGSTGALVRRMDYAPFGAPIGNGAGDDLEPGFAGLFYDRGTRLYLARARSYDPELGRFLQPDPQHRPPVGARHQLSSYAYAENDPVNWVDLDGAEAKRIEPQRQLADLKRYINNNYARFEDAVVLGLGTGVDSHQRLLDIAQGRFQLIDTTSSGSQGGGVDLLEYALFGGRDPNGRIRRADWEAPNVVAHSAGNHIALRGSPNVIRIDPSSQLVSKSEIYEEGIVANVTGPKLLVREGQSTPHIGFSGTFDWNPLEGLKNAAEDAAGFVRGVGQLVGRAATGTPVFESHDFTKYRDRLDQQGKLRPADTYNDVQLRTREGVFHYHREDPSKPWELQRVTDHPIDPPDSGSGTDTPPGGPPPPPGGGGGGGGGSDSTGFSPSKVGGIYLSGAGEALKHLGAIAGFGHDPETGRLVLLSEELGRLALPSLRMDDVVTVFRSVYEHGEAPWVTIDPSPENPRGPVMIVRHGEATADTYVGWVLLEADRVMKVYSLGKDNVTQREFRSAIPDYRDLLHLGSPGATGRRDAIWERFWIVPSQVTHRRSAVPRLTLLDIQLQVNTERMELRNGELVTAQRQRPSVQAEAFRSWFTRRYDEIAREARSSPPAGSGLTAPVAFFEELRRVALIAAVAEALSRSGEPMPAWMREYQVARVPIPSTTPATTAEAGQGGVIRRIYGGIALSPDDRAVRFVDGEPEAESLAQVVWQRADSAPVLTPLHFEHAAKRYRAAVLPGGNSLDIGAARLEATDLAVPGPAGALRLTRMYHSFFGPKDAFGTGWTLDLPRLEQRRRPVRRTGDETQFQMAYQLVSPLATYDTIFEEIRSVSGIGRVMTARTPGDALGLADASGSEFAARHTVLFADGRRMYFDNGGNLVAWTHGPSTVRYRWEEPRRLVGMDASYGPRRTGAIALAYDPHGRVESAQASTGYRAVYTYDASGALARVESGQSVEYRYRGGLLVEALRDGRLERQFEYGARGKVTKERSGAGAERVYSARRTPDGMLTITDGRETVGFNASMQPQSRTLPDGTVIRWSAESHGGRVAEIAVPGNGTIQVVQSPDRSQQEWRLPGGGSYRAAFSRSGQLVELREGDRLALRRQFGTDGQLTSVEGETVLFRSHYNPDGTRRSRLLSQPGRDDRWLLVEYDHDGRPQSLKDSSGSETRISYTDSGSIAETATARERIRISHDELGRMSEVETSWGARLRRVYEQGGIQRSELEAGGARASVEYENGRPVRLRHFDGGEVRYVYDAAGRVAELHAQHGLKLRYEYAPDGQLAAVEAVDRRFEYTYDAQGRLSGFAQLRRKQ